MKQSIVYALLSALLTSLLLMTSAPAAAQAPASQAPTQVSVVRTADLDLGTASGQRHLRQRIAQAAREVCGTASPVDLKGSNGIRKCRVDAIARATPKRNQLLAAATRGGEIAVTAAR